MGQTPTWGLPYPEQSTLITDSAAIVQELAEKIDALVGIFTVPGQEQSPATVYPVAPYLVDHVKTSGPWTPPAGVTVVDVVIVTGGQNGSQGSSVHGGTGGRGGVVRVLRNVQLGGEPIDITVGGQKTSTMFGGHKVVYFDADPWEPGVYGVGGLPAPDGPEDSAGLPGGPGIELTGPNPSLWLAGGGGGGGERTSHPDGTAGGPGGLGGGGAGGAGGFAAWSPPIPQPGARGAAGFGGGGGGGGDRTSGDATAGGAGGAGGVLIFTPTLYPAPRTRRTPANPTQVAAIDDRDRMIGVYAVDAENPQAPGIPYAHLVPFPTAPVDTGRTVTAPADPDDPDGPTVEVPVLAWPETGWTHTETDGWKEPA